MGVGRQCAFPYPRPAPPTTSLHFACVFNPVLCYSLLGVSALLRRWYNHLDPTIRRGPWCEDEDAKIVGLQHKLGNKWAEIATEIAGRCVRAP